MTRKRYRRRRNTDIVAVQIKLKLEDGELRYSKWGAVQRARSNDWLVDNAGEVYTVADETFRRTYTQVSPGRYIKPGTVWATRAECPGVIDTLEGTTAYRAGDYIVANDINGIDSWAVDVDTFRKLYEPDEV